MLSAWKNCCPCVQQRWIYGTLSFVALCIGNMLRSALPITITTMVLPKQVINNETFYENHTNEENPSSVPVYDWDEYTQGLILSSLFWAYAPMQLFYGPILDRIRAKYVMAQAIFVPSVATLVTPLALNWFGSSALICLRFVMGLSSSGMFPSVSTMTPQWSTSEQRSRFGSFICTGFYLGTIFGNLMPVLIIRYFGLSWPSVFHYLGLMGVVWLPFWLLFSYDNVESHPFISESEQRYLRDNSITEVHRNPGPTPYRRILSSKCFWAYAIGLFGFDWTNLMTGADLPKYMKSVLGLSMEVNGYVTAFACLSMWLSTIISAWIVGRVIANGLATRTTVKKVGSVVASLGPALFTLLAAYVGQDSRLAIAAFITSSFLMGTGIPSIFTNNLDLSPNYAGALIAIANGFGCLSGIIAPYIIGLLTTNQTVDEWRLAFWIGFGISLLSSVCVVIHLSAEVQSWNDPVADENEMTVRKMEKTRTYEKY